MVSPQARTARKAGLGGIKRGARGPREGLRPRLLAGPGGVVLARLDDAGRIAHRDAVVGAIRERVRTQVAAEWLTRQQALLRICLSFFFFTLLKNIACFRLLLPRQQIMIAGGRVAAEAGAGMGQEGVTPPLKVV